jgi:WD40 repeat protein
MSYRLSETSSKEEIHEDGVWCVSWRNQSNLIVTGSVDSTVGVW